MRKAKVIVAYVPDYGVMAWGEFFSKLDALREIHNFTMGEDARDDMSEEEILAAIKTATDILIKEEEIVVA